MARHVRTLFCGAAMMIGALAGAASASAATITKVLSFTGTINELSDPGSISGLSLNQSIHGSLTIGPMDDAPAIAASTNTAFGGPGFLNFAAMSGGDSVNIISIRSGAFGQLLFGLDSELVFDPVHGSYFEPRVFGLNFTASGGSAPPLMSLSALPGDKAGILSYLGGTAGVLVRGSFGFQADSVTGYQGKFSIDSLTIANAPIANTPIPPSLVLLVTALGGLGFAQWRQQA